MTEKNLKAESVPLNLIYKEFYSVIPPFGYIGIQVDDVTGKKIYNVIEPTLSEDEQDILRAIKEAIIINVGVPLKVLKNDELMKKYLDDMIKKIINKYKKEIPLETDDKLKYYLMRDFMGYGKIDLLFHDPNIEDISCNGFNTPIYIWHRVHESLSTNIIFPTREELNFVVNRLVYKTGNQISIANPILEGTLPEGYRAHITLDEVSRRGDSFTIRKYRPNPFTVVDLIQLGTISPRIAAYTWILVEYLRSMMVCGAVASGKTALLNSISMFIKPEMKVVTIEEVRELRLHENWIPMTTRPSYQPGIQEITLFDLLKISPTPTPRLHHSRRSKRRGSIHPLPEHSGRPRRIMLHTRRQRRLRNKTTDHPTHGYPPHDATPNEQPNPNPQSNNQRPDCPTSRLNKRDSRHRPKNK